MIIGITMQQPTSDGPHNPALSSGAANQDGSGLVGVSKDYGPGAHFDASQLPPHHVVIPTDQHHHYSANSAGTGVGLPPPPPQQVYVNTSGSNTNSNSHHPQQQQQQHPNPIVGLVRPGGAGGGGTMDMSGLESQFQSLGLRQEEGTTSSTDPSSGPNGEVDDDDEIEHDGADEDDDDEDGEEDPVKLFVGQVR
jgi:hypothetical protein